MNQHSSLVRNNINNDFDDHSLRDFLETTLNSERTVVNRAATKSYVDSLSENDRNEKYVSTVFNDQDNVFDNFRLMNLDTIRLNTNPLLDEEAANKRYVDAELD